MHFFEIFCIVLAMLRYTCSYRTLTAVRFSQHKRSTLRIHALSSVKKAFDSNDWERASKASTLVIVESPAKARTIQKFVDSGSYVIDFSAGHIRDLTSKTEHATAFKGKKIDTELGLNVASMGVDVHDNFKPLYMTMYGKGDIVKRLKAAAQTATRIILATDEDREGEAISWHLLEVLKPKVPYKRAVFHEITKDAILKAFEHPRDLDLNLVQSQETRRILDRLAGFTVSPVLWRYIAPGLSAGRVQSCGLHSITERERSRWRFVPSSYCSVTAVLDCVPAAATAGATRSKGKSSTASDTLLAKLYSVNSRRVANERDFDSATGELRKTPTAAATAGFTTATSSSTVSKKDGKGAPVTAITPPSAFDKERLVVLDESMTQQLMEWLSGNALKSHAAPLFQVTDVDTRKTSRKPPPPFITSSLQQESSRKHGFSPSRTMAIAQSLYEKGHITYMRTDSPTLSSTAVVASQKMVTKLFGDDYLPSTTADSIDAGKKPSKTSKETAPKNAQEAHEAIRPAEISGRFALPEDLHTLSQEEKTLYGLILRRTLASVMKPSQSATCTYTITATSAAAGTKAPSTAGGFTEAVFRSSDTRITFPGFLLAIDMFGKKAPLKGSSTQQEQGSIQTGQLMKLSDRKDISDLLLHSTEAADGEASAAEVATQSGDSANASEAAAAIVEETVYQGLSSARHTTRPPSRFTEASFIQEMEELGVGRPSTYSAILHTLKEREYITVEKQTIIPTIKGMVVCEFLEKHFPQFVDAQFTAEMERNLDLIARGECDKVEFLNRFYLQDSPEASVSDDAAGSRAAILKKGLLPTITQKLRSEEINHAESRRLHVPFLQDVGVLTYSREGASIETFVPSTTPVNTTASSAVSGKPAEREFSGLKWTLPESMQQDIRGVTSDAVRQLLELQIPKSGSFLGLLPNTQLKVHQKSGRYGRFLQVGDKPDVTFYSVPAWMNSAQQNLTLSDALDLIALPKVLGTHPELNKPIIAEMNRNVLSVGVAGCVQRVPVPDGLLVKDVTFDMAMQLLPPAQEISTSGGSLGMWRDNQVTLVYGKFGPYVRSGNIIGGLKGDLAKSAASITLEQAVEILESRGKELGTKFAKPGASSDKSTKKAEIVKESSAKASKTEGAGGAKKVSKKKVAEPGDSAPDSVSKSKRVSSKKEVAATTPSSGDVDSSDGAVAKPKRRQKSKNEGDTDDVSVSPDLESPKKAPMRKSRVMKVKESV